MQFRLISLMIAMTLVAVACGILFAAPRGIAVLLVCLVVLVSPSFWIAGTLSARGTMRAFFIGGTIAGIAPFVVSAYYSVMLVFVVLGDLSNFLVPIYQVSSQSEMSSAVLAMVLFASGFISCLGGGLSVLTTWLVTRRQQHGETRVPLPINCQTTDTP